MNANKRIEINNILAEWNPIEVPEIVASDEYKNYVTRFDSANLNKENIITELKKIVVDDLGLEYSDENEVLKSEIEAISDKILYVLMK